MIGLPMKNAAASLLLIVSLFVVQASAWVPSCMPSLSKKQVAFGGSSIRLFSGEDGSSSIHTGTVKWFDTTKGFGFIVPSDGSGDVFVHQSEIQMQGFRSLADGEAVEYKVATDPKTGRKKAIAVTGPDGAEVKGAPFRPTSDYESY